MDFPLEFIYLSLPSISFIFYIYSYLYVFVFDFKISQQRELTDENNICVIFCEIGL